MMGFFGLAATADAVVSAANNMSPDAYSEHPSNGLLITGGLDKFAVNRAGGTVVKASSPISPFRGRTVSKAFVAMSVMIAAAFGSMLATKYIEASEKAWSSGRCVKLEPSASPGPKGLAPSSPQRSPQRHAARSTVVRLAAQ